MLVFGSGVNFFCFGKVLTSAFGPVFGLSFV